MKREEDGGKEGLSVVLQRAVKEGSYHFCRVEVTRDLGVVPEKSVFRNLHEWQCPSQ